VSESDGASTRIGEKPPNVLDYIELFYNVRRRHGYVGGLSPEAFETRFSTGSRVTGKAGIDSIISTGPGLTLRL